MTHDSHFNADPAFYRGERENAEEERRLQIKYEDTFWELNGVLHRQCIGCETWHKPEKMKDRLEDGFVWKVCSECEPIVNAVPVTHLNAMGE